MSKSGLASNKPPAPEPTPHEDEYPSHLIMSDGREAWVSVPKPDRIALIAPLSYKHFIPKPKDDEQFEEYIIALSKWLASDGGKTDLAKTGFDKSTGLYYEALLHGGERQASAFVKFTKPKSGQAQKQWKLRIEFNPRKLGTAGRKQLAFDLSYDKTFRLARFLADARLTRLDVAVDVVGVEVCEMVPALRPSGKITYHVGSDGSLETILYHRPVPPPRLTYDTSGAPRR